jgi:hypothetical protein
MRLLLDEDYKILDEAGLIYEEDFKNRFLIIKNFPLCSDLYVYNDEPIEEVEVLVVIPSNYNTSGINMFWTHPELKRADGIGIPAAQVFGGQFSKNFDNKEFCRWSRHWPDGSWGSKVDNVQKILDRLEWALRNPNTNR